MNALRLKELKTLFPEAVFILHADSQDHTIKYIYEDLYVDSSINHFIKCECCDRTYNDFKSFGISKGLRISVRWRNTTINISYFFKNGTL
jgi:hypothetical protein